MKGGQRARQGSRMSERSMEEEWSAEEEEWYPVSIQAFHELVHKKRHSTLLMWLHGVNEQMVIGFVSCDADEQVLVQTPKYTNH